MLAAIASGYHGPPQLTFPRAFTSWTLDPWSLAVIIAAGALYLAGVLRVRRRGERWPIGRTIAFCGLGLGFAVIATMSSFGVYYAVLFYMRSVQTILFLLVVPLFLALGRPLTLIIETVPRFGPWLGAAIKSRSARLATFPAITTFVLVLTPFLIYFTPWYVAGFHSALVAQLTDVALAVPGFVFFWTLLRVDPVPKEYPYVVALWITAAEVLGDAALGLACIADTSLLWGSYYRGLAPLWASNLSTKQVLGGGVLWIFGDIVGLPFLAAQLIQMIREDEADAVAIDAELDAREAAAAVAAGTSAADPFAAGPVAAAAGAAATGAPGGTGTGDRPANAGEAGVPVTQRPWWETDRRFSDRFRAVDDAD
jgi:cytochrome c oxidase assembly factor CtaG